MSNPLSREARDAMRQARERIEHMDSLPRGEVRGMQDTFARFFHVPTLLDALDAAEALVSTLGEALRAANDWAERGDADSTMALHDRYMVDRESARAALASYQEWDRSRANPSTGEGTE